MASGSQRPEIFPGMPVTEGMLVPTDRKLPPVPLKHTDVHAAIIGPICNVVVTQQFHNTHTRPIEAMYVFPLPEDAAITECALTIGERVIRGEVREREQAQQAYAQARDAGHGAALVEQERPNLFTVFVANIQPDEQVQVTLRFHDRVPYDDGQFEFVFPTVVLPRYVPPEEADTTDAERVTATPLLADGSRDGHTLSIEVTLDAGKLEAISSPTHAIDIQHKRGFTTITLGEATALPNKDFILRYTVAGDQFTTAAFTYRPADTSGTLLLMLTPKPEAMPEDILPRELLFVVDRSGSMSGNSIVQARNALRACLRALNPGDTFNIFPFDNRVEQFAPQARPFTQENVDQADAYIETISARGGTDILTALQQALEQPRDPERLRVVVFMTDGAVGNEDQVLRELCRSLNEARVYAFGIGSAVNRFLLDKLAEVGRGTVEYIFPGQEIEVAVQRFQNRAAFPVLVDVQIDWGDAHVTDVYPTVLPDLYTGQPLTALARFHNTQPRQTHVRLTGRTQRGHYEQVLPIDWPVATPDRNAHWTVLPQMWARARIDALMTHERNEPDRRSRVRDEILGLALEHHLLSPYTAFIAIEESTHTEREQAERVLVPIHLPHGTHREAFDPKPASSAMYRMQGLAMAAAPPSAPEERARGRGLFKAARPRTSSAAPAGDTAEYTAPGVQPNIAAATRHEKALRYLARTQDVSGVWGDSLLVTALVVLAFVRSGHSDRAGSFRPQLRRAILWLTKHANETDVAPVAAWVLAELASVTGAPPHHAARDKALANATPVDDLDRACLALAGGAAHELPTQPAYAEQWVHNERGAFAIMLYTWQNLDALTDIDQVLMQYQHLNGKTDGAVVPSGRQAQTDTIVKAQTAVGAVVWGGPQRSD